MEEKIKQGYLYDFYGELLNDHQRSIYESFVLEDLSLAEIAADRGISRQAVHDVIRRCNKVLEEYESKLHLVEKFLHIKTKVGQICSLAGPKGDGPSPETMERVLELSQEILEEL